MVVGFLLTTKSDIRIVACLWYQCAETSQRMVMVRTGPLYRPQYKKGPGICMEIDCTHVIVLDEERLDNPAKYHDKFIQEAGWIGATMVNKDPPKNKSMQKQVVSNDAWVFQHTRSGIITYRHALPEDKAITTEDELNTSMSQTQIGNKRTPKFATPKTPASTSTEGTEKCTSMKDQKKKEKHRNEEAKQARKRKEEEEARKEEEEEARQEEEAKQEEKDRKKQEEKDRKKTRRERHSETR